MNTSTSDLLPANAIDVRVTDDEVTVDLADGRTISVPLGWYPRLEHGSAAERKNWRLIGGGEGIHWSELDEDISVAGLLAGRPSAESQRSFQRWLENRETALPRRSSRKKDEKTTK